MAHRLLEVSAARLPGWVEGFAERHGPVTSRADATALTLTAQDGAVARLEVPFGPADLPAEEALEVLTARAGLAADALVLLVRRGGVAVGVARGGRVEDHRSATRYVQSRTAAGGWSQQRFARRRAGQTEVLRETAVRAAVEVLAPRSACGSALVVGGDRALIGAVLADPRLAAVAELPRSALLDVKDPRRATLDEALRRARCVRVHLDDPPPG